MNSWQLHDALKIFLISSHFSFHIFTLHLILCLTHACCCFNEEKIKLNLYEVKGVLNLIGLYIYFRAFNLEPKWVYCWRKKQRTYKKYLWILCFMLNVFVKKTSFYRVLAGRLFLKPLSYSVGKPTYLGDRSIVYPKTGMDQWIVRELDIPTIRDKLSFNLVTNKQSRILDERVAWATKSTIRGYVTLFIKLSTVHSLSIWIIRLLLKVQRQNFNYCWRGL